LIYSGKQNEQKTLEGNISIHSKSSKTSIEDNF